MKKEDENEAFLHAHTRESELRKRLLTGNLRATIFHYLPVVIFFVVVLIAWEIVVPLLNMPRWLTPRPSDIINRFSVIGGSLLNHIYVTMIEILVGFAIGASIGLMMGIGIAYSSILERILYPVAVAVKVVPVTAVAPLLVIWFGYGMWSKVAVVALICFFPFVVNMATGLKSVSMPLIDLLNSFSASEIQTFSKVRLPWSMPHIFSALKVSVTMSVIGAIVGEFVGSKEGLGYLVMVATTYMDTALVFAIIAVLAAIGITLFGIVVIVERIVAPWAVNEERQ